MKTSDLIRFLNRGGWVEIRHQGQHRIFSHTTNPKLIAVPDLGEESLNIGLLNDILREAGFEKARVRKKISFSLKWLGSLVNRFKNRNDI